MSDDSYVSDLVAHIHERQQRYADTLVNGGVDPWGLAATAMQAREGNEQDRELAATEHGAFAQGVHDTLGPVLGSAVLGAAVPTYQGAKALAQSNLPGSGVARAAGDAIGIPLAGPKVTPPGMDQLQAGLAPAVETVRNVVGAVAEAAGLNRPGGPLESALGMLPIKPEHQPPQAGVRALDAPFKMAEDLAKNVVFRPLGDLLRAAGVPEEYINTLKETAGLAANMAIPVNAAGLAAKGGTSGMDALAQGLGAADRAVTSGAKVAGKQAKQWQRAMNQGTPAQKYPLKKEK